MLHAIFIAGLLLQPVPGLRARALPTTVHVPASTIVGRSVCGDTAWLLTDWPELISVSIPQRTTVVREVAGIKASDQPWGLACLTDASLWTLVSPRTLARLTPGGVVQERVNLAMPRLEMFGWIDRLLFMPLPMPVRQPLLATSLPGQTASTPWPAFVGRDGPSRSAALARNLVNCGIGRGRRLPCWFADERRATIADGANAAVVAFSTLEEGDVDQEAPIWDLAIAGDDALWLLVNTRAAAGARKAGGRLVRSDARGNRRYELRLPAPARLILGASDDRCLLLTTDGTLLEVLTP